jgi:hypothetical protein
MNWHWLYEELEQHTPAQNLTLANPFKTRIIMLWDHAKGMLKGQTT